jgi:hypothetical protein
MVAARTRSGENLTTGWSMKKDRELIKLARENPSIDLIAASLEMAPATVLRVARRLGKKTRAQYNATRPRAESEEMS